MFRQFVDVDIAFNLNTFCLHVDAITISLQAVEEAKKKKRKTINTLWQADRPSNELLLLPPRLIDCEMISLLKDYCVFWQNLKRLLFL